MVHRRKRDLVHTALCLPVLVAPAAAQESGAEASGAEEEPLGEQDEAAELPALVITPTRSPISSFDAPYATEVVDAELIERRAYRTTPEALRDLPGVMVQATSHGQGSPFVRGFTGFHNLLLIDGVRLNNSVFRPGPNQYWSTVDPLSLERLELVKGPSSVLYGSDAIGGTVNAITKSPYVWGSGFQMGGELYWRGATAENSHVGRVEVAASWNEVVGALVGGSYKSFGSVEGGSETGVQPYTGYEERDFDVKVESFLSDHAQLVFLHQRVDQDAVPRTHKTVFAVPFAGTTVGSDLRHELDQNRELTYLQLHADDVDGIFDDSVTSLSWQVHSEQRDRVRASGQREVQGFEVGTLGLFSQFSKQTSLGLLTYGFELYHDRVDSFLNRFEKQTPADGIQGPVADDATYDLAGVFLQDAFDVGERLDVILGARFDYAAVDAGSVREPVTDQKISIEDDWDALVGSLRLGYDLEPERWRLYGGVSGGFRTPNLSDLTRFDSARTNEFEIPAPGLEPEHYTSYELGLKHAQASVGAQAAVFYADIRDQIQRVPTGNVNAAGESEVTKANVGDGYLWGIELGSSWRLRPAWTLFGNLTWLEGKVDTFPTAAPVVEREYVDRLMPLVFLAGVRWEPPGGRLWSEARVQHAERAERLSTRDESDTSRIPPGGTPGYTIVDLLAGYELSREVSFFLGLENLTDEDYRVHGSGSNRPGRNLTFGVRVSF